jgi:hypothetical protein
VCPQHYRALRTRRFKPSSFNVIERECLSTLQHSIAVLALTSQAKTGVARCGSSQDEGVAADRSPTSGLSLTSPK